jgi:hypothetical protein
VFPFCRLLRRAGTTSQYIYLYDELAHVLGYDVPIGQSLDTSRMRESCTVLMSLIVCSQAHLCVISHYASQSIRHLPIVLQISSHLMHPRSRAARMHHEEHKPMCVWHDKACSSTRQRAFKHVTRRFTQQIWRAQCSGTWCRELCVAYSSKLKMEAVFTFETWIYIFSRTMQHGRSRKPRTRQ